MLVHLDQMTYCTEPTLQRRRIVMGGRLPEPSQTEPTQRFALAAWAADPTALECNVEHPGTCGVCHTLSLHLRKTLPPTFGHLLGRNQAPEGCQRRSHHVVGVGRAEAFSQRIVDSGSSMTARTPPPPLRPVPGE